MKAIIPVKAQWLHFALRLMLGAVFTYAGLLKMLDIQAFADSIASFRLLPPTAVSALAITLPPFEIITGLLLIARRHVFLAALAILCMGVVFSLALAWALARGLEVDCGCFGAGKLTRAQTWWALARDVILIAATLYWSVCESGQLTHSQDSP